MPASGSRLCALAAIALARTSWGLTPAGSPADPAQTAAHLEVRLGEPSLPNAELLGWELSVDGVPVAASQTIAAIAWSGTCRPGRHTVGVRVRYSRDLKTVVNRFGAGIGLTFIGGGPRWLGSEYAIDAPPGGVLRLAATLDENPHDAADRLVVAVEQLAATKLEPGAAPRHGTFDVAGLVQEKVASVAALLSPQLIRAAGRTGRARVRLFIDPRGYVSSAALVESTGSTVLDQGVESVLRLAEPYPVTTDELTVTLMFSADAAPLESGELSLSALTGTPAYLRAR